MSISIIVAPGQVVFDQSGRAKRGGQVATVEDGFLWRNPLAGTLTGERDTGAPESAAVARGPITSPEGSAAAAAPAMIDAAFNVGGAAAEVAERVTLAPTAKPKPGRRRK